MRPLRLQLFLFWFTFAACSPVPPEHLDIATTTTVSNSGLLAELLPGVKGPAIRVHASDSVHAIAMLYDEVVDLVITHDGNAEARALGEQLASSWYVCCGVSAMTSKTCLTNDSGTCAWNKSLIELTKTRRGRFAGFEPRRSGGPDGGLKELL